MGQSQSVTATPRVEYEENGNNGLLIADIHLPKELLGEILFHADHKTLLKCQLVCKRWYLILQSSVWRKKAEAVMDRPLEFSEKIPWLVYYAICSKKLSEKNLLKNHSGKYGKRKYWKILSEEMIVNLLDGWKVECPPVAVPPLPISEPVFEGQQYCFVTSCFSVAKEQTVDLVGEGLLPQLLDAIQPTIIISDWYCARADVPATYRCSAKLTDEFGKVLDTFEFRHFVRNAEGNKWHYVEHKFANYGPGLRKVTFSHFGLDMTSSDGYCGIKMAGACVRVNLQKQNFLEREES